MKPTQCNERNFRILIVDDNPSIHQDFLRILCPSAPAAELAKDAALLFGPTEQVPAGPVFEVACASQGKEGLALVERAVAEGRPYSLAFVDVRMPPGWDGIETVSHLWRSYPELQVVICTAYSDYSWEQIVRQLGESDSLVILKKPFDNVEVLQLAQALTKKWWMTRQANERLAHLDELVRERTEELVQANERLQAEVERRAKMEIALRESEEKFHKSFETVSIALAIVRADTQVHIDVNGSFLTLTGYSREQVIGRTAKELKLTERADQFEQLLQRPQNDRPIHNAEIIIQRSGKESRPSLVSVAKLVLGQAECRLVAMLDITDQRRLEVQLRQSQKMEAIGQLAAGVAHDFNNLLTVIHGHASIQLAKSNLDEGVARSLEQVKLAAERAAGLTRQLLALSRKQVVQRKPTDLSAVVKRLEGMLARLLGETITLECLCPDHLPLVMANESNLEQVVLNLVVNARDALPNGGVARLSVEAIELTVADGTRHADARPGQFLLLQVEDNGCGMDERTLARLFEPFFTTKPIGKGTGLGLSTVYGIVQQHEGWIEVRSTLGSGSTFQVFLPVTRVQAAEPLSQAPRSSPRPVSAKTTILVVEDEAAVRDFICDVLEGEGYSVLRAACGKEALEVWETAKPKIDLLFTDMVMPNGITGSVLARVLLKRDKTLKVIYASGYSTEAQASGDLLQEGRNFLAKPFTPSQLLSAVETNLRSNGHAITLREPAFA